MNCILSSLLLLLPFLTNAQKGVTVTYEFVRGNTVTSKQLLAINDYVSFEAIIYNQGSKQKVDKPLGSGFRSHNTYTDKTRNLVLRQSQPMSRPKYLVKDTIQKLNWILSEDEQVILGYTCKKAVAEIRNNTLVAWYAPTLPFSFGPHGIGGLPGLILEINYGLSNSGVRAIALSNTVEQIVEPNKGNLVTMAEFSKILSKLTN